MSTRARAFCFTINNWTEELLTNCLDVIDPAVYSVIGFEEAPTTGTKHIQGYVYYNNAHTFQSMKKKLKGAHLEIAKGSAKQNRDYCIKSGEYNEFGTIPQQGKRNDINDFKDAIISGMDEISLINEFPTEMAHFDRFYNRCRNVFLKQKAITNGDAPEVIVLIGEPGCGKTRHIYDNNDITEVYKLEVGDGSSGSIFWNGYDGQEIILIDDFHNNLKLDYMLRLLDRYPMQLNTKGGYTWRSAKKIYITSNIPVEQWYHNCPDILRRALRRRITTIINLQPDPADYKTYNNKQASLHMSPEEPQSHHYSLHINEQMLQSLDSDSQSQKDYHLTVLPSEEDLIHKISDNTSSLQPQYYSEQHSYIQNQYADKPFESMHKEPLN